MNKTKNPISKVLGASLLALGLSSFTFNAFAQSSPAIVCPGHKQGKTSIPGERVGKKIQRAFEAYSNDLTDEAILLLKDIETSQTFDRAYTDRFLGNLLAAKPGAAKESLTYLERAVAPGVLNETEQASTIQLIANLNMQEKNYTKAIEGYKKWMDYTCKQDPQIYVRLSQAYYETKQLAKMVEPADKAIALFDKPNKNPFVLKLTSFYERKMYPQTVAVAETLVKTFPDNKQWWTQLAMFYMLIEDYKKSLSTFEISYKKGYLEKESQIKALAQLYATNSIPHKSAEVLEKHIKSGLVKKDVKIYSALANTLHQAKDLRKAAYYYGKAAELSKDPEHYRKQGTLLLSSEDYKGAAKALQKALDAGSKKVGRIQMAMMEANFYQGKFKQAFVHVKAAQKDKSTSRSARSWEPYIKEKAKNRGITL